MRKNAARVILGLLAVSALQLGVWATLAPHNFFETFPGAGRHWVAVDGPYNQHLMRDFGGLNLALGILLAVAAVNFGRTVVRTAVAGALAFGLPHLLYHATHLSVYGTADKVTNITALAMVVLGAVAALVLEETATPDSTIAGTQPSRR